MTIEQIILLIVMALIGYDMSHDISSERKRVNKLLDDLYKRVERLERKNDD